MACCAPLNLSFFEHTMVFSLANYLLVVFFSPLVAVAPGLSHALMIYIFCLCSPSHPLWYITAILI